MGKQVIVNTILFIIGFVLMVSLATAQETRDYAITAVQSELIEDDTVIRLTIVVENLGADAVGETDIIITAQNTDDTEAESREILTDTLSVALDAGTSFTLEIPFDVTTFPSGSVQTLTVTIGVDRFELANTVIAENNVETIDITIPVYETTSPATLFQITDTGAVIAGEAYTRTQVALFALGFVGVLMLFWVFSIVIRLIFRRTPKFGAWQPPYGVMPMYDQNTLEGRRWSWQQHAQNGLLLAPPTEGNVHAVKLLLGAQGGNLANWTVTAMRLSQYDTYGRIARTQVFADKKAVRRFNKALKKRGSDHKNEAKLQRRLRPIGKQMVKKFTKKVGKKTGFLPVAFDIRLSGEHGTVRIVFELYQCREYAWYRIDQWEPMMQVMSQSMQENYTFTIHGKDQGETMRDFRERLQDDLMWLLLESIRLSELDTDATSMPNDAPAARQQYDVPDTLSGMEPLDVDAQQPV